MFNDDKVKLLHIMLSKTNAYEKSTDGQIKRMYFLIEDDDSLWKYNTMCDKVSANIKNNLIVSLSTIKIFWKPK